MTLNTIITFVLGGVFGAMLMNALYIREILRGVYDYVGDNERRD